MQRSFRCIYPAALHRVSGGNYTAKFDDGAPIDFIPGAAGPTVRYVDDKRGVLCFGFKSDHVAGGSAVACTTFPPLKQQQQ